MNLQVSYPNVDEMDIDEILSVVTESNLVPKAKSRYNLLDLFYSKIFNYSLEKDLILSVLDESNYKLILAPAGSGKTTTIAGAEIILEKIYRKSVLHKGFVNGDNMLYLVYNRGNVRDIKKRHTELVSKIKLSGLGGVDYLNDDLKVYTLHGFCSSWIQDSNYLELCKLKRFNLVTEESEETNLMSQAVGVVLKTGNYGINPKEVRVSNLMNLYSFKRETMMEYEDLLKNDKFIDLALPLEVIKKTFDAYEATKKIKKKYDYTDQLLIFYRLVSGFYDTKDSNGNSNNEHVKILERLRQCYEYIAADELQDFTPLMMSILVKISEGVRLTCIGDDDQSLYEFKGADSNNILKFQQKFPSSKVFLLKTNRRCPKNIVDLSRFIIDANEKRFKKDIKSMKPNGIIEYRPYTDRKGQLMSVVSEIKSMTDKERSETCICYRNQSCSAELSNMLMESGIHFHILSGLPPFRYGLYKTVIEVLRLLAGGSNKRLHLNLYKCLPVTRDEVNRALKYDPVKGVFTDNNQILHLSEIDFGNKKNNQTFVQNLNWLIGVSRNIDRLSLNEYFPRLLTMIKTYYWDYLADITNLDKDTDKSFTNSIIRYFCVGKTFPAKFSEYERDKRSLEIDQLGNKGVCVSTFHSLKGLEFDNVILIDLQESIFPNTVSIDMKPYDDELKKNLKESETRLFYVAVTRPKKRLIMYYHRTDPSVYITKIFSEFKPKEEKLSAETLNLDIVPSVSFVDSVVSEDVETDEYELSIEEMERPMKEEKIEIKTPKPSSSYNEMIMETFFG